MHDSGSALVAASTRHTDRGLKLTLLRFLASGLVIMGLIVLAGWAGHVPALTRLGTSFPGLPYSTALAFVFGGLALLATEAQQRAHAPYSQTRWRHFLSPNKLARTTDVLCGLLIILGTLALLEWYAGFHLGLSPNPAATHVWAGSDPVLYRMHPLAGFGFIIVGLIIFLHRRIKAAVVIEVFHAFALLSIFLSLLGVIGGFVGFDRNFPWLVGPIFLSGTGFAWLALGLLLLLDRRAAELRTWSNEDGRRIVAVAGTIIVFIGLSGFIAGFGTLYRQAIAGIDENLALDLQVRSHDLERFVRQSLRTDTAFANQPPSPQELRHLDGTPGARGAKAALQGLADRFKTQGYSSVVFRNAQGSVVARAGGALNSTGPGIALKVDGVARLVWNHGPLLLTRSAISDAGKVVGFLDAARPLPDLGAPSPHPSKPSLAFAACGTGNAGNINCLELLPGNGGVLRDPAKNGTHQLIPAANAIGGKAGLIHALDRRGVEVITAYQPIASLGLGTVLKIDAARLYAPIARRTGLFLIVMMGLATATILLLRLQVLPMVRKMAHEIDERKKAEERHRLVLENGADAILVTDPQGSLVYANQQTTHLLGYPPEELLSMNFPEIAALGRSQSVEVAQGQQRVSVESTLKHKNGEEVPVEICAVELPDGNLYSACRDITERKKYEARLQHQATHDALTGLANRTLLTDRMEQSIIHARRTGRWVAAMLLDLDRFKLINDSLGHAAGDALLREIAKRLTACVRPGDTVARLGGDEFMVVMSDLGSEDDAAALARKLLDAIARPLVAGGHDISLSGSLGVSMFPRDGESPELLFKCADVAMYGAKELGRNGFQFFGAEMNHKILERIALESGLRQALERNELELFFQPKVSLRHGQVVGAEALIRWRHPQRGLVPPADFIPLAEESSLITAIGDWVIQSACRHLRQWADQGLPPISVAVNVSARQFKQQTLCRVVEHALSENRIEAQLLEVEVTESAMMDAPEKTIAILHNLKKIGVRIALDDFGTGYSSLSYLKLFPIDSLKIDQSFVRDINSDPNDAAIARMLIVLGHTLNEKVIAEGVETLDQLQFLKAQQCDEIQGFLFSAPVPAEEFARLLREGRSLPLETADCT